MVALRDYQMEDLVFHIANEKSLNLSDPGTGKTPTVCVLSYYHWTKHQRKTLWSMPKSLLKKNREEMLRFSGYAPEDVVILESDFKPLTKSWTGPTFTRMKRRRIDTGKRGPDGKNLLTWEQVPEEACDLIAAAKDAKVFIMTFAFLRNHWRRLFETIPELDVFLVDELHMGYGGPDSGQTESFYWTNRKVSQFCGMTGTLVNGRLDSAFPAVHVVEPRYYGSHTGFLDQHATFIDDYGRVLTWGHEDKLSEILRRHSVRHTFEEVYGDEPVVFFTDWVDMNPQMRENYDKFHDQAMLELEDGFLDGTLPGVATIRASQIMAHPETMGLCLHEQTAKDERLEVYAAENQPMLVFTTLQPEQERCFALLRRLGKRVALINDSVSASKRSQIDEAFRAGDLDAIVGSWKTCAVGWNWERAEHVVGVSVDYQDVDLLQGYRRGSRGTRTTPLRVTFMGYRASIDSRKFDILKTKSEMAHRVDPTRRIFDLNAR